MRPVDLGLPAKFASFRSYTGFDQLAVAQDIVRGFEDTGIRGGIEYRFQMLQAATGSGKSLTSATVAALLAEEKARLTPDEPFRWLVLTGTKGLQVQYTQDGLAQCSVVGHRNYPCMPSYQRLATEAEDPDDPEFRCLAIPRDTCGYTIDTTRARESSGVAGVVGNYAHWLSLGRYSDPRLLGDFDLLVMDECFVPGTLIGSTPIEKIRVGDVVPSFDPHLGVETPGRVTQRTFQAYTKNLVRIRFAGREVICTKNHPILTPRGWTFAGKLTVGSVVLCSAHGKDQIPSKSRDPLPLVREDRRDNRRQEALCVSEARKGPVFSRVQEQMGRVPRSASQNSGSASDAFGPNEGQQPNEVARDPREGTDHIASNGLETSDSGWQRPSNSSTRPSSGGEIGVGDRVCGAAREETKGIPDLLQVGYRGADSEGGNRGRWSEPSGGSPKGPGQEKSRDLVSAWVESVEILEPGGDGSYGGVCPGGIVYNLEVESHHTYLANGLAVHNCHSAGEWLTRAMQIYLSPYAIGKVLGLSGPYRMPTPSTYAKIEDWYEWLTELSTKVEERYEDLASAKDVKGANRAHRLAKELALLRIAASPEDREYQRWTEPWVMIPQDQRPGYVFSPRWGADFAERYLFRDIPRVLLTSATVTPQHAKQLGIPAGEMRFREVPSPFDPRRRPVIWVPTTRVDFRMTDGQRWLLMRRIDQVIEAAIEQGAGNGVIHTGSYERMREIARNSKYAPAIITHEQNSADFQKQLAKFMSAGREGRFAVIASPRMVEGVDLVDDLARWQFILKLPFPDSRDPLTAARAKDRIYRDLCVSENVTQMIGRLVRNDQDFGTTIVGDDHWVHVRNSGLFAQWLRAAFRRVEPEEMIELLTREKVDKLGPRPVEPALQVVQFIQP